MSAPILRNRADLRSMVSGWKSAKEVVGVVPTMGALHAGHLSLVEAAKADCERVIVTIFVNPKQFDNTADLTLYPRTETEDAQLLAPLGVDVIYAPEPSEIYPRGFSTTVSIAGVTNMLEGEFRPGHFDGVSTVVTKLFLQTDADRAYFGEKDYQQLLLVKQLAQDLDIQVEVIGCPTVRESSGLAMSSRNRRLSPKGRQAADRLVPLLQAYATRLRGGGECAALRKACILQIVDAGFDSIEYLDLRDGNDLSLLRKDNGNSRLFFAGTLEGVRLIDNIAI